MTDLSLQIEYVPIGSVIHYAKNSRDHSEDQVRMVMESIKEAGFVNPCLVDANGVLIAGHCRTAAAARLGMKEVPVIRLGHLTETQAKALRIKDNQLALLATWNGPMLKAELTELSLEKYPMKLLGFKDVELVSFLSKPNGADQSEDDSDDDFEDETAKEVPELLSPFPYFGGKRSIAIEVWTHLGEPKQYIEPFCGSAAVLLAAPKPASLEVVNDASGFIANFWRATKHQAATVAEWADYPVSHIDLGARHVWLMAQRDRVGEGLHDPDWPGDAKVAGWWLWGQCCWIGSGWCEWFGNAGMGVQAIGRVPHAGNAGMGVQAIGRVPHAGNAGRGVQAIGQVLQINESGRGVNGIGKITPPDESGMMTSCGRTAMSWLRKLADRLERVRITHGDWTRCLNNHFGGDDTAIFFDPPYKSYEKLYDSTASTIADQVEKWAVENENLRIALCGHVGDYNLPGWTIQRWDRGRLTYSGGKTTRKECVWYSPACLTKKAPDGALS